MPFARISDLVHSLRFRLTLWVTLMVFLIVVVTMLVVNAVVRGALFNEFDKNLREDLREVELEVRRNGLGPPLQQSLEQKAQGHALHGWFVQLFGPDRVLRWSTGAAPQLGPLQSHEAGPLFYEEGALRLIEAGLQPPELNVSFVRLGSSKQSLEEDIALLNRVMVLAGVSILVLAPVGGYLLYRRAMRPLSWIIDTTARLQPKNLKERLPMRGTGDELDQLSKTINGMLDRIAAYIESNRDFLANAAHELRSPLAAIRSSVDVALDRLRTPDEYSALLTDVAEECNRLTNLLNQLMLLAEGDAGRLALLNQTARLDKIVREAVDMFEAVAEALSLDLQLVAAPAVSVRGEEYHLRQVVRNLIDNAIKFTPPGGRIEVELSVQGKSRQAQLRVADTGIGISSEELPRIFERFYRVDKSRTREWGGGNGLGLAICQAVVAALEGRIDVVSQPGGGTTFTIVLPLVPSGPEDASVATEELSAS